MKSALLAVAVCALCRAQATPAEEKVQAGLKAQRAGDLAQAAEAFSAAVRLDPKLPPARVYLGAVLLESGKTAEAIEQLERAAELLPQDPRIRPLALDAAERAALVAFLGALTSPVAPAQPPR